MAEFISIVVKINELINNMDDFIINRKLHPLVTSSYTLNFMLFLKFDKLPINLCIGIYIWV